MKKPECHGKILPTLTFLVFLVVVLRGGLSWGTVSGQCYHCHTMHNSQNAGSVITDEEGTFSYLLVTDCVGCHTSSSTSTIIDWGSSRVPIVYNTTGYPAEPLAGGNFYWVAQGGEANDAKGHNVYGIAEQDSVLSIAPGRKTGTCTTNTCHASLADSPQMQNWYKGGCQGCHVEVAHHDDAKPWYRFLKGHNSNDDYVTGVEDPDWEQVPVAGHNRYQGYNGPVDTDSAPFEEIHTISGFCGGCHGVFHKSAYLSDTEASPWVRHPTDILLPDTGEYAGYDPVTDYSAEAPVAWLDPETPTRAEAVVMCLSCHRAHGSEEPDLLRWSYGTMLAGEGGSGGCFTCHTTKN